MGTVFCCAPFHVAIEQARLAGEAGESTLSQALAASMRHLAQAKGFHSPEQEAQP